MHFEEQATGSARSSQKPVSVFRHTNGVVPASVVGYRHDTGDSIGRGAKHASTFDIPVGSRSGKAVRATDYKQTANWTRAELRRIINRQLREITGNPTASMKWTTYRQHIVQRYRVIIEGWPDKLVPLKNLSSGAGCLGSLQLLWIMWERGITHFRVLSQEEYGKLEREGWFARTSVRATRYDKGSARGSRRDPAARSKKLRFKVIKSARLILDEDE